MPVTLDPRIDTYISKAAPFAQPILTHLRKLVHQALPDVEEGIKWGMPHFMIDGKNCAGIAAFKAHCALVLHGEGRQGEGDGMGSYGKIVTLADLPADAMLVAKLQGAANALDKGGKRVRQQKSPEPEIPVPDDFSAAMKGSPAAQATLDQLAPSHRREYLAWITGAKQAATRERRIAQAVEWLAEGRRRNWKYESR